jgi:hypothetical protein
MFVLYDISEVCTRLRSYSNVTVIRIVKELQAEIGKSDITIKKSYSVNTHRVLAALRWLKNTIEYPILYCLKKISTGLTG